MPKFERAVAKKLILRGADENAHKDAVPGRERRPACHPSHVLLQGLAAMYHGIGRLARQRSGTLHNSIPP
jgi:hypothetical protein